MYQMFRQNPNNLFEEYKTLQMDASYGQFHWNQFCK